MPGKCSKGEQSPFPQRTLKPCDQKIFEQAQCIALRLKIQGCDIKLTCLMVGPCEMVAVCQMNGQALLTNISDKVLR